MGHIYRVTWTKKNVFELILRIQNCTIDWSVDDRLWGPQKTTYFWQFLMSCAHVWPGGQLNSSLLSLCHSQHRDRTIPVLIIGILVFLPGFYHLRIAYYASKGYRGYSYDDIPDFDDWATGTYCQPADVTEIWTSFSCRWCLPRHNDLTDSFFFFFSP